MLLKKGLHIGRQKLLEAAQAYKRRYDDTSFGRIARLISLVY